VNSVTHRDYPTIFALSSGNPPAGIGVIRISGPLAGDILARVTDHHHVPRIARYSRLRDPDDGTLLDHGLSLWFPGPHTATGEDLAELHVHGSIAIVDAVLRMLGRQAGLRLAEPGEFTRRALENGRMDLDEAEGLADLLRARTERQRKSALLRAEGGLGRQVREWERQLLAVSAQIEAALDFSDEDDVGEADEQLAGEMRHQMAAISAAMSTLLAQPPAEPLADGIRVVLAGPPNAGKSSLLNALIGREAAIVDAEAGTTRDVIEVQIDLGGYAMVLIDTAGLRDATGRIEQQGIARAQDQISAADILLWLGEPSDAPDHAHRLIVHARCDEPGRELRATGADLAMSARSGLGMDVFRAMLLDQARQVVPAEDQLAVNRRQRHWLTMAVQSLSDDGETDLLLLAERCRLARQSFDTLTGRSGIEDMLGALFGQFCIGK
jgi:tRNA modification GTPase